jgi:hypothetical protein
VCLHFLSIHPYRPTKLGKSLPGEGLGGSWRGEEEEVVILHLREAMETTSFFLTQLPPGPTLWN